MNHLKIITVLFLLTLNLLKVQAQSANEYKAEWDKIEKLEKAGLVQDALNEVVKLFDAASKAGNDGQSIKAAMYQMKYRNMVELDNRENNIFYLDTLIARAKVPTKNVLQSMQAELFYSYRQQNRYRLYSRTALTFEVSNDVATWSIQKLNATIEALYKASLQNETMLKRTPLNGLDAIIEKGKNSRQLRPTLYDFLAHRALDYFMNGENDVTQPAYRFIINNESAFAPVGQFVNTQFTSKDTTSLYYNAIIVLQNLLRFHLGDVNKDALLDADLKRLSFVNDHGVFTDKSMLYINALQAIEKDYAGNKAVAKAMHLRAQEYMQRGSNYNALTNPANQFDLKKAKEICELAIKTYPKSAGAIACQNLLTQIQRPALSLETEKVNIPGEAFRTLVRYKNSPVVYLRLIRTNRTELQKIEAEGYENNWTSVLKMAPLKSWSVKLPDPGDYQQHSAEIKVDGLPAGTYIILASLQPNFSMGENVIARQTTYVSNISYIFDQKQNVYVLHRNSGLPLASATVQLWEQRYDYAVRRSTYEKKEKYNTGKNGELKLIVPKERQQQFFEITYGKDTLFTNDPYYNYSYDGYNRQQRTTTFLFMDRAIYRPGQTVFFKGIVVHTDSSGKKSSIAANYKTNVELYDANYQKIGTIAVTSNAYGSYNGSFQLPSGILNGQFFIKDAENKSQQFFKVEEYKRPKFITEISKPAGTYRLNEMVKVTGNAKAYAGNNIDGAKVSYRVVRKVRFPIWWYGGYVRESKIWPPYGREAAMEIANGETVTDADGNFEISFKAIPDETINKKDQPIFYYEVTADVTDVNGETRSGETMVAVAYQALKLDVTAADKMPADSLASIQLTSKNMNDVFEQAKVNLAIYSLKQPATMYRKRYWEVPDQFVMTKAEFNAAFPNDPYSNEDQPATWALGPAVVNVTDTTTASGAFKIPLVKPTTGWYKVVVTTKDKYGEAVTFEKYVYLVAEKSPAGREPVIVQVKNKIAEPGESFVYSIHTAFDKVWLIQSLVNANSKQTTTYHSLQPGKPLGNSVAATEADRGGMMLNYVFVQHNRVYEGNEWLNVPWSNKELQVSYETFRDKILPGSNEKWSVTIKGSKGDKASAELLVNMYDASLDQFAPHSWSKLSSLWPSNVAAIDWVGDNFTSVTSISKEDMPVDMVEEEPVTYDALINNGWNEGMYDRIMYMRAEAQEVGAPAPQSRADDAGNQNKKTEKAEEEAMMDSTSTTVAPAPVANEGIQVRKNFNETAFFFPSLETDAAGNVTFSFTIPEALTQWKLMTLAHNKDLASGYSEKTVITQKPLMVQPNAPRFIREGDRIELVTKLVNMSDKELTGTVQLQLMDAANNKSVDGWFKNVFPNQYFTVAAGQSVAVKFPVEIPYNFNSALSYQLKAITKDGLFSDGEEAAIPVLSNRMLVTETFPINMRNISSKQFSFTKLLNSFAAGSRNDATLTHHALTFEFTSNPAWYAVQALPYLADASLDNAEQQFSRYYANALAGFVANSNPKIKAVFSKWKISDTAALLSNLQKNEELKNALLEETPWVLEAKSEAEQKKNIALLFDMVRMANEKAAALNKLKEMQSSNGGFTWFKGGPDDRYMTQYIVTGLGHLGKLKALNADDEAAIRPIINKAIPYLDARLKEEYENLIKYKAKLTDNHLSYSAVQYLYMRSFFPSMPVAESSKTAVNFYRAQAAKYWLTQSKFMQAMIALAQHRTNDAKTAKAIIASLKQHAIVNAEMGMYWKEFATGGYYWHQAPIESQALMIEAFSDIDGNTTVVDDLKTWLLKQKQTQHWKTTKATAEATYALLLGGSNWIAEEKEVTIQLGNGIVLSNASGAEAGTGYFKQRIEGAKVVPSMGNITVNTKTVNASNTSTGSTSWGAVYWQYFEDLDKITSAATPLSLVKKLYVENNSDRGPVLRELKDGDELKIGDKVKVRIELRADRNMEYVHMKDMRAASMEPVNVLSGYKYQGGLGYYESTKDASTSFFFSQLPRGTYVFEYSMFVTNAGNFSNGITTIQSMYAPEFSSHSNGIRVTVE